jgi:hypothetical protein
MGFRSLQHSRDRRSTGRGPCQGPLRSALRVWLPSRRLTPSEPLPVFFHTGGALGIRPAELSPSGRYPPRFRGSEPTYRFSRRCSRRRSGGPAQQAAVSGLSPFRESLATERALTRRPLAAPLGFALLGSSGKCLARGFTRTPPTRFTQPAPGGGGWRRPGVSIDTHLTPPGSSGASPGARTGQPFQGFRTGTIPNLRTRSCPGYGFTLRRVAHCCRPADTLGAVTSLYRSCSGLV